jgi:hypothetical protein
MNDADRNRPHFYELNWLGKAVYLGGTALRLSANLVDRTIDRASVIVEESKAAYLREVDPNIEDAKIIEEHIDR